jgi:uncharacterized protein YhdP
MVRALLWLLVTAGCATALVWGIFYGLILPRIDRWKPDIEEAATQALGVSVRIGTILRKSGSWLRMLVRKHQNDMVCQSDVL